MNPSGEANDLFDPSVNWFPPFLDIPLSEIPEIDTRDLSGQYMDSFNLWLRYLQAKASKLTEGEVVSTNAVLSPMQISRFPGFMVVRREEGLVAWREMPALPKTEGVTATRSRGWLSSLRRRSDLRQSIDPIPYHLQIGGLCLGRFAYKEQNGSENWCMAIFESGMFPCPKRFSKDEQDWAEVSPRKWGAFTLVKSEWPDPELTGLGGKDSLTFVTAWHRVE